MRNIEVRRNGNSGLGLWDEFDRVFQNFFDLTPVYPTGGNTLRPAYDVQETETHFVLSFDLPGMKQEDINIEVQDNVLSITGERKREETDLRHSERFYGRFERQFTLPENVTADGVEAQYENGVLKLALPKIEEVKPKKVQININANKEGGFFSRLTGRAARDVQ